MTILLVTPDIRLDYMNVRWDVFVCEQNVPMVLEIDARDFQPGVIHMAAYSDEHEAVVGAVRLIPDGSLCWRLGRLAVAKHARGQGIGRELVSALHSIVQTHTPAGTTTRITLEAQCHARAFYEDLGYIATSENIIVDAGIDHIEMAIELHHPQAD